ncbi:hypothetical protein BT96DRAFT_995987 [Gymnopus androsaceus JB14]|uniref:Uncharacterized protein n=1 Tax=Gymnopus androsaceus JB14 TaxID=1447944 RepID=A0A6A4HIH1_9AGAR|nr:hypothetical protein BT96DRAFT_995987 [Gymnopus androsaceus JB14]
MNYLASCADDFPGRDSVFLSLGIVAAGFSFDEIPATLPLNEPFSTIFSRNRNNPSAFNLVLESVSSNGSFNFETVIQTFQTDQESEIFTFTPTVSGNSVLVVASVDQSDPEELGPDATIFASSNQFTVLGSKANQASLSALVTTVVTSVDGTPLTSATVTLVAEDGTPVAATNTSDSHAPTGYSRSRWGRSRWQHYHVCRNALLHKSPSNSENILSQIKSRIQARVNLEQDNNPPGGRRNMLNLPTSPTIPMDEPKVAPPEGEEDPIPIPQNEFVQEVDEDHALQRDSVAPETEMDVIRFHLHQDSGLRVPMQADPFQNLNIPQTREVVVELPLEYSMH